MLPGMQRERPSCGRSATRVIMMYAEMSPRSRSDPAPKVDSAIAKLRGIRREHEIRGIHMAPLRLATRVTRATW